MPAAQAIRDPAVARAFQAYPAAQRGTLLRLRRLILTAAARTPGVGMIEETLKWGQPAYLTVESKSGSTIRLGSLGAEACAMFFNCQTSLVATFKSLFPNELQYSGNRAIVFSKGAKLPTDALKLCIEAALTYHRTKRACKK